MGEFDVIPKLVGRVTFADRVLPKFTTAQVKKAVLPHKDRKRLGSDLQFDSVTGETEDEVATNVGRATSRRGFVGCQ